jgi:Predicted transcriptional regulator
MQLTKAEEQIMQILWTLKEATVKEILNTFPENRPARTTVATILSILENKNFVEHHTDGRINIYRPLISKESYSRKQLSGLVNDYFGGSFTTMVSFFATENNLDIDEVDQILKEAREELLKQNKQ